MGNIKVSVIIPVFNTVNYLKKCIDSFLHQTLKDIEIIIVDDASTQDIKGFLEMEYGNSEKIVYLRNERSLKPGGARNRGLDIAKGKYISFCDSDDWVDLNLYEETVKYMDAEIADIGMVSMVRDDDFKTEPRIFKCEYRNLYRLNSDMAIRIISHQYEAGIKIVPACINKIYRRSFLEGANCRFEEDIYYQGILFSVKTFLHTEQIICIPNVTYHHYLRYNSITQSFDDNHMDSFYECFKRMKNYFTSCGLYNKYEFNYYKIMEHYLNVVISEIFEYIPEEQTKKKYLLRAMEIVKSLVDMEQYLSYVSAEELRQHIQPNIKDTFSVLY